MNTITSAASSADLVTVRLIRASRQWSVEIYDDQRTRSIVCSRDEASPEPPTDTAATLLLNTHSVLVPDGAVWAHRAPGILEVRAHRI
ncbi:hypothetical protein [Streptomyces sp. NPDC088775]|uniref:hypothetical protein n=1 Tax=Streptomyces sp. NPDC088775 TaxID=3365896 RepID=UPI00381C23A2